MFGNHMEPWVTVVLSAKRKALIFFLFVEKYGTMSVFKNFLALLAFAAICIVISLGIKVLANI